MPNVENTNAAGRLFTCTDCFEYPDDDQVADQEKRGVAEAEVVRSLKVWLFWANFHKASGAIASIIVAACAVCAAANTARIFSAATATGLVAYMQFIHPYEQYKEFMRGWRYLQAAWSLYRLLGTPKMRDVRALMRAQAEAEAMLIENRKEMLPRSV